jgi:hypothetical protein
MSHRGSCRFVLAALTAFGIMSSGARAHAEQLLFPIRPVATAAFESTARMHDLSDPVMSRLFAPELDLVLPSLADAGEPAEPEVTPAGNRSDPDVAAAVPVTTAPAQPQPQVDDEQAAGAPPFGGQRITPRSFSDEGSRPVVLLPLYATFTALQMLDASSTLKAIENGGREANPMVAPFTSSPAALYSLKAATAVGTIFVAEKMWKRSRVGAIVTMVALNVGYAFVAHHNFQVAGR